MAWQAFQIEKYEVDLIAHNTPGYTDLYAAIRLYWGGEMRATLFFHRDSDTTIPANSEFVQGGVTTRKGRFSQAQFQDSLDLLRNEKPVFFQWNNTSTGVFLSTAKEPVGEEESP